MAEKGTVIENLVVRLVGDNSHYKKAMQEADAVLKQTVQGLKNTLKDGSGYWKRQETEAIKSQEAVAKAAAQTGQRLRDSQGRFVAGQRAATDAVEQFTRDAQGRLRDFRGRFVAEGGAVEAASRRMIFSFRGIGTAAGSLASGLRGVGNQLNSFTGRILAVAGAGSVIGLLYKTVQAASDSEESIAKFNAVFNNNAKEATKFVAQLADDIGRSEQDIRKAMSAYQSIFVGLNFAPDKAFEMSMALEKLTLDFAAFHNISDEETMGRFVSAMSGSAEVLDQFGVNIRQAALGEELLRMGINKSSASASEAERTMARLNVIMEVMGSQGALGAAAREAQSFANRMKDLKAELLDLSIAIGNELMPMALDTVKWLKDLTVGAKEAGTGVGGIGDAFLGLADTLHVVALGFQGLQSVITSTIAAAVNGLAKLTNQGTGLSSTVLNALEGIPQLSGLVPMAQLYMAGEDGKGRFSGIGTYGEELDRAAAEQSAQYKSMSEAGLPSARYANRAVAETDKEINREVTKVGMDRSGIDIEGILTDAATSFGKEVVDYGELFGLKTSNFMYGFLNDAVNLYNVKEKEDQFAKQTAGSAVRFGSAESELSRRSRLETATEKNTAKIAINTEAQKRLNERTATAAEGILGAFGNLISIPH
jgi:hypothetical protein